MVQQLSPQQEQSLDLASAAAAATSGVDGTSSLTKMTGITLCTEPDHVYCVYFSCLENMHGPVFSSSSYCIYSSHNRSINYIYSLVFLIVRLF